jgi:hypothetical protein
MYPVEREHPQGETNSKNASAVLPNFVVTEFRHETLSTQLSEILAMRGVKSVHPG